MPIILIYISLVVVLGGGLNKISALISYQIVFLANIEKFEKPMYKMYPIVVAQFSFFTLLWSSSPTFEC